MHICLSWPWRVNSLCSGVYCCNFEHNNAQRMLVWLFRWINSKKYSFCYYTKLLGGILVSLRPSALLSVCLSVCPSVSPASRVHSLAPTVLVGSISYLYQATSGGVSLVKLLEKFHNLNFWHFFKICSFDFVLFWLRICCESLVWVIVGGWVVGGGGGGISECRHSSYCSGSAGASVVAHGVALPLYRDCFLDLRLFNSPDLRRLVLCYCCQAWTLKTVLGGNTALPRWWTARSIDADAKR